MITFRRIYNEEDTYNTGYFMPWKVLTYSSASCYFNLLYMGFISAGAYTLWGVLLKYNPVSRVSIFGFMNPVMGVLLSAWFLGENNEAFSLTGVLSLLLVAAGIMIVNIAPKKKDKAGDNINPSA